MANDIDNAISANPIKNGTVVITTTNTGQFGKNDDHVSNKPEISDIEAKYDNRFYNGIFVKIIP